MTPPPSFHGGDSRPTFPSLRRPVAGALLLLALAASAGPARAADATLARLDSQFGTTVKPFLKDYCVTCHGGDKPEAGLDLNSYSSLSAVVNDGRRWNLVLSRIKSAEMPPPKDAAVFPSAAERSQAVAWFQAVRDYEIQKNAGDPGLVLARRLNNAEYNYSIRDLTGFDIQPTREFPADPSNMAGFDNSGESLAMSPSLLNKYLQAAREVASHMFLKPEGFAFSPYPMMVETDRDKYCVQQIINFYHQQDIDYADYFQAAWRFKHRVFLGVPNATLADFAAGAKLSAKYLNTVWTALEGGSEQVGPMVKLQALWRALPGPGLGLPDNARAGCEGMRNYVVQVRKKVEPRFINIVAGKVTASRQPLLIWKDVQYATHRRTFDPAQLQVAGEPPPPPPPVEPETGNQFGPGKTVLVVNKPGDPDLTVPAGQRPIYEAAFGRFCSVFPDMFYKEARGRNYFDTKGDQGRYLSAGFHNVMGYFRDDEALYELILDEKGQQQLDEMWHEMDFVASTTARMYGQFSTFGEARGNVTTTADGDEPAAPVPEDSEYTSEVKIRQLEKSYLDLAKGANDVGLKAVKDYFEFVNTTVRWVEKTKLAAEPGQLQALQQFAAKAFRRPLEQSEKDDLLVYYHSLRTKDGLPHEEAMRESIVGILMAPDFCYRIDLGSAEPGTHPLSDYDLASRLSYFLWSSSPDAELLAHAAAGDLHQPAVVSAQAKRMLKDPHARALALEFGGNWLDFRHFAEINTVDLTRYPSFTPALRDAMLEEPVRFLQDAFQANRPVLDLLYAHDTFVNPVLAKHYGMPAPAGSADTWVRMPDADHYDRGGLLPMAVFLTKNAPGLRTSPVKRGNWVVKNILGEKIPPPPPVVPELPHDEAKMDLPLRDMLARHRENPTCAACHARFDALGLVFEGFGPAGEKRTKDLAGRAVDASASFPSNGGDGSGVPGLRQYIQAHRQGDFVDNFCNKLLAYALGRTLMLSDDPLLQSIQTRLAKDSYHIDDVVDSIVTSPQFLNKRGRDGLAEN